MKKIITLLLLAVVAYTADAQLANQSFETWHNPPLTNSFTVNGTFSGIPFIICAPTFSYQEPTNWSSTNQLTNTPNMGNIELVTKSTNAQEGTYSIKLESKDITISAYLGIACVGTPQSLNNVGPGLIVNGSFSLDPQALVEELTGGQGLNALNPFTYPGVGQAIDFIPKSISGYYQYTGGVDGTKQDSCIIVSGLKKDGELIGHVVQRMGNTSSWTPFSIDYSHLNCETPDTIVTVIAASSIDLEIVNGEFVINSDFTGINGSELYIDGLHIDTMILADFPPLLMADRDTILIGGMSTLNVLGNDEFCDNGVYSPTLNTMPTNGTAVVNANDEVEYTPNASFVGTDEFTYYICNVNSNCDTTTITIEVEAVPICYANDDVRTVDANATDQFDPRVNDVDCGTTVNIVTNPTNGSVSVLSNNNLAYSPNSGYTGVDNFEYSICSTINPSQCDTATVNITVISGINEIDKDLISIKPNPAQNVLNVSVDLNEKIEVRLFNTLGKVVLQDAFENNKALSLDAINMGLYFLEIKAGNKKSVRKIQVVK